MSDGERRRNQEAFIEEQVEAIVATVAFGISFYGRFLSNSSASMTPTTTIAIIMPAIAGTKYGQR